MNAAGRFIEPLTELAPISIANQRIELLVVGSCGPSGRRDQSQPARKALQESTAAKLPPLPRLAM